MKILKYTLIALGGLIVLIAAVLAYIAATFDPNQYKPHIVQAVKERSQRTLKLEGDITLSFWPGIGAKIGKVSLSERASDREFAAVEEVRVFLKLMPLLSGRAVVDTVRIKGLRAHLVKTKDGKTNVDDLLGAPPAKEAPAAKDSGPDFKLDVAGVEITGATITYADQAAGAKYALSKLNLNTGRLAPGVPSRIELSFHTQGENPKLDLQTTLKSRLAFDPGRSLTLDDLLLESSGAAAGMTKLAFKVSGNAAVEIAKERAQANVTGKLADSSIKARLEVAGFAAPAIKFDVEVDQLDVDRYLAQPAGRGPSSGAQKQQGKEKPFDLSGLRNLRAAGSLKIGALKANNVRASAVRLDIKANGGRVDVNPLTANFYQGTLSGSIAVNAAPATPAFAVKHNMSGVNIGPLLKDLAENDTLEGRGNVMVDVTSQGNTVSALKKALNGNAALKLVDGAVKGIDIASSIRNAKARLGTLRGEQTQAADKSQKTDFSELTATFNIANGVARNNDLSMKSPLLRVGGEGVINIGEDSLNYFVKASIVGTTEGQGGRDAEELKGITVPVRVTGPLAAPSYQLDLDAMATDTARQKVKDRLRDQLEKRLGGGAAKDQATAKGETEPGGDLRDALKGLFRR